MLFLLGALITWTIRSGRSFESRDEEVDAVIKP